LIGRQGRNNMQKVGAYETTLKWNATFSCNAKFKGDSWKIDNSSSKRWTCFSSFLLMLFQYLLLAIFSILDRSIPWYLFVTEKYEICKKKKIYGMMICYFC
jgi:hypothetical protein